MSELEPANAKSLILKFNQKTKQNVFKGINLTNFKVSVRSNISFLVHKIWYMKKISLCGVWQVKMMHLMKSKWKSCDLD